MHLIMQHLQLKHQLYKRFDKAYKKGTERFYYFEVENGFIGFEIPNMEQAEILSA